MEYLLLSFMGFVAALTPGPDIFYIIRQGLCRGKKAAFIAVFGILTGNIIYLSLVAIIGSALAKNLYFQLIIGFLGSLYLFKIAYLIYQDKPTLKTEDNSCKFNSIEIYKEALFLNLSNPKAMIFFAVVITPFMAKSLFLSLISLFIGIALAFIISAYLSSIFTLSQKVLIIINKVAAVVFVGFGFLLLFEAYKALSQILQ